MIQSSEYAQEIDDSETTHPLLLPSSSVGWEEHNEAMAIHESQTYTIQSITAQTLILFNTIILGMLYQ